MFACARYLALFYVLAGLFSNNSGPVCSDSKLGTPGTFGGDQSGAVKAYGLAIDHP